ncbi:phosphoenolpyruvate--protein phosphotransferase [bacterium]|nr:phosphoenolpyruvate--protein phosphotransferase [bacterium]
MPTEISFRCPLPDGLHARPASLLAELVGQMGLRLRLHNERSGQSANCASVIELVAAAVLFDDPCRLSAAEPLSSADFERLLAFIQSELPLAEQQAPAAPAAARGLSPAWQEALDALPPGKLVSGLPISAGLGRGRIVPIAGARLPLELSRQPGRDPLLELGQLERAQAGVELELSARVEASTNADEKEILRAGLALLRDPALAQSLHSLLGEGLSAAAAVVSALESFARQLGQSGSIYLRERAADLRGIGLLLLAHLGIHTEAAHSPQLEEDSIVVAENLSPAQFLALRSHRLAGLVLGETGSTSHAAILARSFAVPAIAAPAAAASAAAGELCIIDGSRGFLLTELTPLAERLYELERSARMERASQELLTASSTASSADGVAIEIAANIASAEEASAALECGADGIGLFRTELLFYERTQPPTEEEQYSIYRRTVESAGPRAVIFRTIDIGGDKPLDYLQIQREANPFLGFRGLRIYGRFPELIRSQLRALLRASLHGSLKIMAPMVSTAGEAADFRALVESVRQELQSEGLPVAAVPVGVMVEVPSAALQAQEIGRKVDFISVGSNDLCQYTFAADRGNPAVAWLHNVRHPAFLRLLRLLCEGSRRAGCWTGLCGEMAGDPRNLPLLLGLGFDELSLSSPGVPALKRRLRGLDSTSCRALLDAACNCESAEEVEALLDKVGHAEARLPLLSRELVCLNAAVETKAQAIHYLCHRLYASGRTDDADALEQAIWQREATYSTGLGHGFAIPHCKSSSAAHASLSVLRPARPIHWAALDEQPVHTVIMLCMPEQADPAAADGNLHLRVFAALARLLMREEFRDALSSASDDAEVCELLSRQLNLPGTEVQP